MATYKVKVVICVLVKSVLVRVYVFVFEKKKC